MLTRTYELGTFWLKTCAPHSLYVKYGSLTVLDLASKLHSSSKALINLGNYLYKLSSTSNGKTENQEAA